MAVSALAGYSAPLSQVSITKNTRQRPPIRRYPRRGLKQPLPAQGMTCLQAPSTPLVPDEHPHAPRVALPLHSRLSHLGPRCPRTCQTTPAPARAASHSIAPCSGPAVHAFPPGRCETKHVPHSPTRKQKLQQAAHPAAVSFLHSGSSG